MFDTSVLHSAANEAPTDRYVLMMRVWHHALAPLEVEALSWIFRCLDDPELAAPPTTELPTLSSPSPMAPMSFVRLSRISCWKSVMITFSKPRARVAKPQAGVLISSSVNHGVEHHERNPFAQASTQHRQTV